MKYQIQPIPPKIDAALQKTKSLLGVVEKAGRTNQYKFVTVDDVYAKTLRATAEAGLNIIQLEQNFEVKGEDKTPWLYITYQFILSCGGETWTDDTCKRTQMVMLRDATSPGAAQSYAHKTFLRSLLTIPTGEVEIEEIEHGVPRKIENERKASMKQVRNKNGYSSPKQIADDNRWQEFENAATNASDLSELSNVHDRYADLKTGLKEIPFDTVIERAEERIAAENAAALEQMKLHGFVDQAEIERLNLDKVGKHKDAER